jgi:hypothetical protein
MAPRKPRVIPSSTRTRASGDAVQVLLAQASNFITATNLISQQVSRYASSAIAAAETRIEGLTEREIRLGHQMMDRQIKELLMAVATFKSNLERIVTDPSIISSKELKKLKAIPRAPRLPRSSGPAATPQQPPKRSRATRPTK